MTQNNTPTNSKRWQDSSDGWVKTMTESKEKKESTRILTCDHGDFDWCEVCKYDENGAAYDI